MAARVRVANRQRASCNDGVSSMPAKPLMKKVMNGAKANHAHGRVPILSSMHIARSAPSTAHAANRVAATVAKGRRRNVRVYQCTVCCGSTMLMMLGSMNIKSATTSRLPKRDCTPLPRCRPTSAPISAAAWVSIATATISNTVMPAPVALSAPPVPRKISRQHSPASHDITVAPHSLPQVMRHGDRAHMR